MQSEGRIAEEHDGELTLWQPAGELGRLSGPAMRWSRGFLAAPINTWSNGLLEHWLPLFHILGSDVSLLEVRRGFELPRHLSRISFVELDGEPGFIGFDQDSAERLVHEVVPGSSGVAAEVVLEYLERRFLSTLQATWSGSEPLTCNYLGPEKGGDINECAALIMPAFSLSGSPLVVWLGFGPRMTDQLDVFWRNHLLEQQRADGLNPLGDQVHGISVEVAELAVPPALLIDYMRSGTIIDLEVPVSDAVLVRINGKPWVEGRLRQYENRFAVEITDTEPAPRSYPEATTVLRVQVAETELDEAGIIEHSQAGALLLCDTEVSPSASLIISGEEVAFASVGLIEERFALQIRSR